MKKQAIFPPGLPRPRVAYSPLVTGGPFVFVSGLLASDLTTGTPAEATINPRFPHHGSDIARQSRFICENLERCLSAGGSSPENVLFYANYLEDVGDLAGAEDATRAFFGGVAPPHASLVVDELPIPGCRSELDCVAYVPQAGERVEVLDASALPVPVPLGLGTEALLHYGVKAGPWIMTSALTATDYADSVAAPAAVAPEFPYYGEAARLQADYILGHLRTLIESGGGTMADVVKAEVFMTDLADFFRLEAVWKDYFPEDPPARTTVPVKDLGIPGLKLAVNLIAYVPESGPRKRTVHTEAAPRPLAHEPQAVQAGPLLFFSQQMATDFRTGVPAEARVDPAFPFYGSESAAQVGYIVRNVEAICAAAGTSSENLVRRRGFYVDFSEFFTSFATWGEAFPSDPPASTTVRVPAPLLVPGCKVAIDLIALVPGAE